MEAGCRDLIARLLSGHAQAWGKVIGYVRARVEREATQYRLDAIEREDVRGDVRERILHGDRRILRSCPADRNTEVP